MPFVYAIIKTLLRICKFRQPYAGMAELADVQVLGSCAIGVWVQIPLPAPQQKKSAGANVPSALFVYLRPGFRISLQYCIGQAIVGVPFFFV